MQTSGSVFAGRIEQIKKTKYEQEFGKNIDCFLVCYGSNSRNLVTFETKSFYAYLFSATKTTLKR